MTSVLARYTLAGIALAESGAALSRFSERKQYFAAAAQRALAIGRKLVVIGDPDAGMHTRLLRAYGCGDVCVDLVGCSDCPDSVAADITRGVPQIASDSAVVFVSCVLEYVSDPEQAWREILRIAGSPENVWIVPVQPWTISATLYPGAVSRWRVLDAPPGTGVLTVARVTNTRRLVYAAGLAGLVYAGWLA